MLFLFLHSEKKCKENIDTQVESNHNKSVSNKKEFT